MPIKVGVMFDAQEGVGWDDWAWWAREIEDLGFESLWRSDHLVSIIGRSERPTVDAYASLVFLAQATRRVRFGTLVSPVTWRHPSVLALTAASISALSGGRLEVGVGAGWNEDEHASFGIPLPAVSTRLEMLEEAAQVLRLLWREQDASFHGKHFTLDHAHCNPELGDAGPPPLIIGALSPRTIAIAARHADEWNTYSAGPLPYPKQCRILERECEAVGREAAAVRRSLAMPFAIGRTDAELRERIDQLASYFPLPLQFPPELAPFTPEALRGQGWVIGTPSTVIEQLEAIANAGVHRVMLHHLDPRDHESIALLGEEVLPVVQASDDALMAK